MTDILREGNKESRIGTLPSLTTAIANVATTTSSYLSGYDSSVEHHEEQLINKEPRPYNVKAVYVTEQPLWHVKKQKKRTFWEWTATIFFMAFVIMLYIRFPVFRDLCLVGAIFSR